MRSKGRIYFAKDPEKFVQEAITKFVQESSFNHRKVDGGRYFDSPLVGFASASDPLFKQYKKIIGRFHFTPQDIFDIYVMLVFGGLGYFFRKFNYEPAPLVLAFVLGPLLEKNLRQALILSDGSMEIFLTRPVSAGSLLISVFLLFSAVLPSLQKRRRTVITE